MDLLRLYLAHWRSTWLALLGFAAVVVGVGIDHAPVWAWSSWAAAVVGNAALQAFLCKRMEHQWRGGVANQGYHPLLVSLGLQSALWGAVPVMLCAEPVGVVLFAAILNIAPLFNGVTAPGTRVMRSAAAWPLSLLGGGALMWKGAIAPGLGYAGVCAGVAFYGHRVHENRRRVLLARDAAEAMAEQLQRHQQQLLIAERDITRQRERQRLMQSMHDGIGRTLAASLAEAERGQLAPASMAHVLRDCLDELRAVIESLEGAGPDLVTLLAALRPRLERQLHCAGMRLHWQVEDLPALQVLEPPQALQAARIVQTAIAHLIDQADPPASGEVRIAARTVGHEIEVCVASGSPRRAARRDESALRRLASMQACAAALGGTLEVHGADAGPALAAEDWLRLRLRLPVATG